MKQFKLKFGNPVITLDGVITTMVMHAILSYDNKYIKSKVFRHKITLRKEDKYDLNKAKNILQTIIEQKAYIWAKKFIDKEMDKERAILNEMKMFFTKAKHIIIHDNEYLKQLIK